MFAVGLQTYLAVGTVHERHFFAQFAAVCQSLGLTHTLTKLKTAQQAMVVDWFSQDGALPNINKVFSAFSDCLVSQHLTETRQQIMQIQVA